MASPLIQHVFIPGLFEPLDIWNKDFEFTPSAPLLVKRLSRFKKQKHAHSGLLSSIYAVLGGCSDVAISSHADACYQFDFDEAAASMDVLCAAPIELEAGMSDIVIGQHTIDDLSVEEQQQLVTLLNQHFSQDGWEFVVSNKASNNSSQARWFLLLPKNTKPSSTIPIQDALGASLRTLVEGVEDVQWSRQLNELQMLLYGSLTNQHRENNRQRTVSSFWLWDVIIDHKNASTSSINFVAGGGYDGQVIATAYGLDWSEAVNPSNNILNSHQQSGIYIYDRLLEPAGRNDLDEWQERLGELESFLVPLLDNGSMNTIIYDCDGSYWSSETNNFLSFLRRRKKTLLDFV